jgi:hypothetical protein
VTCGPLLSRVRLLYKNLLKFHKLMSENVDVGIAIIFEVEVIFKAFDSFD